MNNTIINLLMAIDSKTMLFVLMGVLIAFIVLLTVLGIVFIVALRKRAPVVKVVMAPRATQDDDETDDEQDEEPAAAPVAAEEPAPEPVHESAPEPKKSEPAPEPVAEEQPVEEAPKSEPAPEMEPEDDDDRDDDAPTYVIEGTERVRYDRSLTAKIAQLKHETKDWYSEIKNEMLSYSRVKARMSWRRESFRVGRMTVARLTIRGKTLCLLLAVEPAGYAGTKFSVEDVSNVDSTMDTPTLYRIKSVRRLKYAKEMIAGIMKELKCFKNSQYEAQDFFIPYEGDMALMQRGLVKRIVTNSTRTFKIEEVEGEAQAEVASSVAEAPAEAPVETNETK